MARILILAESDSRGADSHLRGKLFEELMTRVVRQLGYEVTPVPNRHYAGMEIDIEAKSTLTQQPLYVECKFYASPLAAPKVHSFFGKYMSRWGRDKSAAGLLVAVPSVNSHGHAFLNESIEDLDGVSVQIVEESRVVELIVESGAIVHLDSIREKIPAATGTPGDSVLVFTEDGFFWAQYVVPEGQAAASRIGLFNSMGQLVTDDVALETLEKLHPEFSDFEWLRGDDRPATSVQNESVEERLALVQGSSAFFEYQFPAAPEYFVGRTDLMHRVELFVDAVLQRSSTSRSFLVEAASGWGKSSFVLSAVAAMKAEGHYAIAIDSRSVSSSRFVLNLAGRIAQDVEGLSEFLSEQARNSTVSGFEGAFDLLSQISNELAARQQILMIVLDQFENVFFQADALQRIHELFVRIRALRGNIVLGFAWKTDLVGVMDDFPFQTRDAIKAESQIISLPPFGEAETGTVLEELRKELRVSNLRQDLRFLLAEYSQGLPWLLKKLCAHVRSQMENGSNQAEIASGVLNVSELFDADLRGLTTHEEEVLRAIAKSAPIAVADLGDDFDTGVVGTLINQRLVVRVANRYDIYWDIFRDYLNTSRLPVQEHYILRLSVHQVLARFKELVTAGGRLKREAFAELTGVGEQSLYNVIRDMRMLGLVSFDGTTITAIPGFPASGEFDAKLRGYLREKLVRNRMVSGVVRALDDEETLSLDQLAGVMATLAPYVAATDKTWLIYSRAMADWLDFADLVVFDREGGELRKTTPGAEVRERSIEPTKRKSALTIPRVQYTPVAVAIERLVEAVLNQEPINWEGLSKSTIKKALGVLTDLDFISRTGTTIRLSAAALRFYEEDEVARSKSFAERALKLKPFAEFIEILNAHADSPVNNQALGRELAVALGFDWRDGTAETNAKIMLDWARHTGLAPGAYQHASRGRWRATNAPPDVEPLFG